mgnify:CR=1 FL=1
MKTKTKTAIKFIALVYCILWLVTALFAPASIDITFDKEHSNIFKMNFPGQKKTSYETVIRIPFVPLRTLSDMDNNLPTHYFKCRTRGIAIAPFIVIDEASWQEEILSGWSGIRLNIWFFGKIVHFQIKTYWIS